MKFVTLALVSLAFLLTACNATKSGGGYTYPYGQGFSVDETKASKESTHALIEQAKATVKKIPVSFEWRFTGQRIKNAAALLESGSIKPAYVEASRALFEAESALQQSDISNDQWQGFVVK